MGRRGQDAVSGRGALHPSGSPAPRLLSPAVRDAASWDKFQLVTLRTASLGAYGFYQGSCVGREGT